MAASKAVLFDLVGTLIRVRGSVGLQYAEVAREFDIDADPEALERAFPAELANAPSLVPGTPEHARPDFEREVWRGIVRRVFEAAGVWRGRPPARFDDYFGALFAHFATAAAWEIYPDVEPELRRLEEEGKRVGLVSNFDARVFPLLESLGLSRFFDVVAVPSVAGAEKPGPGIFRFAAGRLALAPGNIVMVGDSVAEDVDAARRAGLRAVLLDRNGTPNLPAAGAIGSLTELSQALTVLK